jgi:hypothetical protein
MVRLPFFFSPLPIGTNSEYKLAEKGEIIDASTSKA